MRQLVGGRGRSPGPAVPRASGRATGDVGRHRAGVVRPLGARTPAHLGQVELAEAIRYARSHRTALGLFLDDGRAEIDSSIVQRALRPQVITRKNSLFAGSAGGGQTWASIATMLQTYKMNGVDPCAWAKLILERIANRLPDKGIEALRLWNFKPAD